jgi:hypothetical protein
MKEVSAFYGEFIKINDIFCRWNSCLELSIHKQSNLSGGY